VVLAHLDILSKMKNCSFNNLDNKDVQMLEVASNELSSNIIDNDEFNNLHWGIRDASC